MVLRTSLPLRHPRNGPHCINSSMYERSHTEGEDWTTCIIGVNLWSALIHLQHEIHEIHVTISKKSTHQSTHVVLNYLCVRPTWYPPVCASACLHELSVKTLHHCMQWGKQTYRRPAKGKLIQCLMNLWTDELFDSLINQFINWFIGERWFWAVIIPHI